VGFAVGAQMRIGTQKMAGYVASVRLRLAPTNPAFWKLPKMARSGVTNLLRITCRKATDHEQA
jgi:hypothetical protein